MDKQGSINHKIALIRGKMFKRCSVCGFRYCTCQTSLNEFEGFQDEKEFSRIARIRIKKDHITKMSINKWGL